MFQTVAAAEVVSFRTPDDPQQRLERLLNIRFKVLKVIRIKYSSQEPVTIALGRLEASIA